MFYKIPLSKGESSTEAVADYEFLDTERSRSVLFGVFEVVSTPLNHLIIGSATPSQSGGTNKL